MRKVASGYKLIFGYLGLFIIFVGIATLLPLLALPFFPNEASDWYCFAIPGGSAIVLGFLLFSLIIKKTKSQLGKHQDSILLVLVWISAILISAVPFIIKGKSFTNSVFESTSAYATVGLSIFEAEDYGLHLFVLYRSLLCFVGGIGLVLIVTSAISDRYGLKLYLAEGHNDKLMPNLARSARLMLTIYVGITAVGVVLYVLAGTPLSLNKQGEDKGTRYRTGVYYEDERDFDILSKEFFRVEKKLGCELAVELQHIICFYRAEDYHQDYLDKTPGGYCHLSPEMFKLAAKYKKK